MLEEAQQQNQAQSKLIADALEYVKSNPPILSDADLSVLAQRVAEVIKIGNWKGNSAPRFNESKDKALVDFTFQTGMDRLIYTATFHEAQGVWKVRGVHETSQAFAPTVIIRPKQ
jgi:hypothetical protein